LASSSRLNLSLDFGKTPHGMSGQTSRSLSFDQSVALDGAFFFKSPDLTF
jgi:hypothetical protein